MLIKMIEQREYFSSRAGGQEFRHLLNDVAKGVVDDIVPVELDFTDVEIVTSGFADEAFGKLAMEMGLVSFMRKFFLSNMNDSVKLVIERAMRHRIRLNNLDD